MKLYTTAIKPEENMEERYDREHKTEHLSTQKNFRDVESPTKWECRNMPKI
jgi:hypothetical protein